MALFGFAQRCDECNGRIVNGRCEVCGKRFGKRQTVEPAETASAPVWEQPVQTCRNCGAPQQPRPQHTRSRASASNGVNAGILGQRWLCIVMLLLFPLVGLILLWKYKHFSPKVRVAITFIFGLQLLSAALNELSYLLF